MEVARRIVMSARPWSQRLKKWRAPASIEDDLSQYAPALDEINRAGKGLEVESDAHLQEIAASLKKRTAHELATLDELLVEYFALAREAARRVLGMRPFDVQVIAGLALHEGKLVEMQTGEGKTLAAVLPAGLNAMTGRGVHILTFNDYLARRDAAWMGPVYRFLGLSVGVIQEDMGIEARRAAYKSDITYATGK